MSDQLKDRLISYVTILVSLCVLISPIFSHGLSFFSDYCALSSSTLFLRIGGTLIVVVIIAVAIEVKLPSIRMSRYEQASKDQGEQAVSTVQKQYIDQTFYIKRLAYTGISILGTLLSTFGDLAYSSLCP